MHEGAELWTVRVTSRYSSFFYPDVFATLRLNAMESCSGPVYLNREHFFGESTDGNNIPNLCTVAGLLILLA